MARRRTNSSKRYLIISLAVVTVLVLGAIWYFYSNKDSDKLSTDSANQSASNTDSSDQNNNTSDSTNTPPDDSDSESPLKSEDENGQTNVTPKTVSITKVWEDSSQNVIVQTKLTGTGWKTCNLTFTQGSKTVKRSAEVIFQPEFSTCAGFSLRASEFPAEGSWSARLAGVTSTGKTVTSDAKTIKVYYP